MRDESKHTSGSGATALTEDDTHRPEHETHDANRDPITGEPGSHPVGTGVGAAAGAAAGAAVGAAGGPVGALVGGTVGAIVGGLAGHGVAEQVNPSAEDAYWRENYKGRDYVEKNRPYEDYQPAYRYGWESRGQHAGGDWDEKLEKDLERDWDKARGQSNLSWQQARPATEDAWRRANVPATFGITAREVASSSTVYSGTTGTTGTTGTPGLSGSHYPSTGNVTGAGAAGMAGSATAGSMGGYAGGFEAEESYWRQSWKDRPYAQKDLSYDDYQPAYRYGYESRSKFRGRSWDPGLERELESGWDRTKGASRLTWERAKSAVRDAWDRVERAMPGDADRDGR